MADSEKNFPNVASLIAVSFAVGFSIAGIAFLIIFCEGCFLPEPETTDLHDADLKCNNDPRCLPKPDPESIKLEIVTPVGIEKAEKLKQLVREPIIQQILKRSNEKDSKMSNDIRTQIYILLEKEWTNSVEDTSFMESTINNDVSDFLRGNLVIPSEKFGHVTFGEHILTNTYGANVAVSIKTDNYDQSQDDWWQFMLKDEDGEPFARECEFDSSAGIFSEDIIIKILDENGEFIGMLNSATPCDVTQESLIEGTPIEYVPLDNITPVGDYKISYLQEFGNDPLIHNALKLSNRDFSGMTDEDLSKLKEDTEWPSPQEGDPNAFQISILENRVSDLLRESLEIQTKQYGQIQFPEMILTNALGATIASTDRTYNYIQSEDEWWKVASQHDVLVRHCGHDKSINMNSEDIIVKIYGDGEEFIGILNVATPCNVILDKPLAFYGDSN